MFAPLRFDTINQNYHPSTEGLIEMKSQTRKALILITLVCSLLTCISSSAVEIPDDSWFKVIIKEKHVGWAHLSKSQIESPDGELLYAVDFERRVILQLREDEFIMELKYQIVRDESGNPVSMEMRSSNGMNSISIKGEMTDDGLAIYQSKKGEGRTAIILDETARMPYESQAQSAWLEMLDGRNINYKQFSGNTCELADVSSRVLTSEPVEISNVKIDAFRIEITTESGVIIEWRDENGKLLKCIDNTMPGGLLLQLCDKSTAQGKLETLNLFEMMSFGKTETKLPDINTISQIEYKLTLDSGGLGEMLIGDERQKIVKQDGNTMHLSISRIEPDSNLHFPIADINSSMSEYLAANKYLGCEDENLIKQAREIIDDEQDAWIASCLLLDWVYENLQKGGCPDFATATETLAGMKGDCSEHGVLLAAFLRCVGIPSKVVFGMLYHEGGFYCHIWVEAYIGDTWIAMDPIQNEIHADVGHIKLTESSLNGIESLDSLMTSAREIGGQLEIDVVEYSVIENIE